MAGDGVLRVVVTDDYRRPEVRAYCASASPVLLVQITGPGVRIGPLLQVEGAICYDCLAFYLGLHRGRNRLASEHQEAAALAVRAAIERAYDLRSAFLLAGLPDGEVQRVPLRTRGNCAACGPRLIGFEENVSILAHPASGIVELVRVEAVPGTGMYVAVGSVLMPEEIRVDRSQRLFAGGKGRTAEEARHVLVLEAAERFSALYDATERLLLGTVENLTRFPLESLLQLSAAQYVERTEGVSPLCPDDEILWAPARSLVDGSEVPVPAGYAFLDYVFEIEKVYHRADTSGCAAGETPEAAIRRALLEAIERDALAIWWYNQAVRPEPVFAKGELAALDEASAVLSGHGRNLHLFDLTHDLGVPVVAATSAQADGTAVYLGAAADQCIAAAAQRAIGELLQFWYWDLVTGHVPESRRNWIREGSYHRFPFLRPETRTDSRSKAEGVIVEKLIARGLHPCFIDLTRPEIGIPVVRAVVPGLRHHGRRFAPGRLFEVPLQLGWLNRPRQETEMNPYPCPL